MEGTEIEPRPVTAAPARRTKAQPAVLGPALVTGVGGFIGSHLAEALVRHGANVVGVDRRCPSRDFTVAENLAGLTRRTEFRLLVADLCDFDLIPWLRGVQTVYHFAGVTGVRGSWGPRFEDYVDANLLATHRVVEACAAAAVPRLVLASSSSVYGHWYGRPSREDDPTRPLSPYGVTKLAAESLALAYARRPRASLSVMALRYFTVYGPRQRPDMAISRLLRAALTGRPVRLFGDGGQQRDFTYIEDAVTAAVAEAPVRVRAEVLNVGGGRSVALREVVRTVAEVTGRPVPVAAEADQPGDVHQTQADLTRAAALLGYQPTVGLDEGIARQWAWMTSATRSAHTRRVTAMGERGPRCSL